MIAARVAAWVVLGVGVVWPAAALVRRALSPIGGRAGLSVSTVHAVLLDDRTWRLVAVTAAQAAASAAFATGLGLILAWCMTRRSVFGGRAAAQLSLAVFVVPTLAMGAAVRELSGWVPALAARPWMLIVIAHVWFNIGFVARALGPTLASVGDRYEHTARLLGRGRIGAALLLVRLIAPDIAVAAGLVAVLSATSFGVILVLGGGAVTTLEVEVWYQATRLVDLPVAAVLSGVQLGLVAASLAIIGRLARRRGHLVRSGWGPETAGADTWFRSPRRRPNWLATVVVWAIVGSSAFLPLAGLISSAARRSGAWTFEYFRAVFDPPAVLVVEPGPALWRSLVTSCIAGVVAGGLAMVLLSTGRSSWSRRVSVGPLGASAATVGLAWLVAFRWPIDLRGTVWIVMGVQVAVITPIVVLMVGPTWDAVGQRWRDAASMAGAGPWRWVREIRWPMIRPVTSAAVGLAAAAALGEIGATSVVSSDRVATAPVTVQRLLARPGELAQGVASATSLILVVLAVMVVGSAALLGRHRRPRFGGVRRVRVPSTHHR